MGFNLSLLSPPRSMDISVLVQTHSPSRAAFTEVALRRGVSITQRERRGSLHIDVRIDREPEGERDLVQAHVLDMEDLCDKNFGPRQDRCEHLQRKGLRKRS